MKLTHTIDSYSFSFGPNATLVTNFTENDNVNSNYNVISRFI